MWADPSELKKSGGFSCHKCPKRVQELRRCREDRMDFTEADNIMWPMYIVPGGELYNFCPGKSTWDIEASSAFRMLIIAAETGTMIDEGGISNQPAWWVELLSEFVPRYNQQKIFSLAKAILGKGK